MTFTVPGWAYPFAVAKNIESYPGPTEEVGYPWFSFFVDELKLSQSAHLQLLQGGQLSRLFLASSMEAKGKYEGSPPFFLLNARYPNVWDAPYIVRGVVLGKLAQLQDGMDLKSVLTRMAAYHLKTGFRRPS